MVPVQSGQLAQKVIESELDRLNWRSDWWTRQFNFLIFFFLCVKTTPYWFFFELSSITVFFEEEASVACRWWLGNGRSSKTAPAQLTNEIIKLLQIQISMPGFEPGTIGIWINLISSHHRVFHKLKIHFSMIFLNGKKIWKIKKKQRIGMKEEDNY